MLSVFPLFPTALHSRVDLPASAVNSQPSTSVSALLQGLKNEFLAVPLGYRFDQVIVTQHRVPATHHGTARHTSVPVWSSARTSRLDSVCMYAADHSPCLSWYCM